MKSIRKQIVEITGLFHKKVDKQNKPIESDKKNMQELLYYLRVCIKYVLLDLEATRRENEALKEIVREMENK